MIAERALPVRLTGAILILASSLLAGAFWGQPFAMENAGPVFAHSFLARLTVVVAFLGLLALVAPKQLGWSSSMFTWVFLALYGLGFAVASLTPGSSWEASTVLACLSLGMLFSVVAPSINSALVALLCLSVLQAGAAIVLYVLGRGSMLSGQVWRAGGTFANPVDLYVVCAIGLPISLWFALRERRAFQHLVLAVGCALIASALLLTWYRAAALVVGASSIGLCLKAPEFRKLVPMAVVASLVVMGVTLKTRTGGEVGAGAANRSASSHYGSWASGLRIFADHPVFGIGAGRYSAPTKVVQGNWVADASTSEPKNLPLLWAAEFGIPGIALFMMLIGSIGQVYRSSPPSAAPIFAAWCGLIAAGVFETPLGNSDRPVGTVLFGVLICLSVKQLNASNSEAQPFARIEGGDLCVEST